MSVLNFSSIILSGSRVAFTIIRHNGWRILCRPINLLRSHCSSVCLLPQHCCRVQGPLRFLIDSTHINNKNTDKVKHKHIVKSQSALTQDLYFNVSRLFNELLNKQGSVPKSRQGLRVGPLVILLQFLTNTREKSIRV